MPALTTHTLSKSDFMLASSCPVKLLYKKRGYPTAHDTNEYMAMLAQGGYIVGKMATLLYPEGIEIEGSTADCIARTQTLLEQENVTLFEAAIALGQKLVRADILVKSGKRFDLIEVKAKSHDTDEEYPQAKLKDYTADVAYQYNVLRELYPDAEIRAFLLTPDKSKRTSIDELAGWFSLQEDKSTNETENEALPAQQKPRFRKPEVLFHYENDPQRELYIRQLKEWGILNKLDVTEQILDMQADIQKRSQYFLDLLNTGTFTGPSPLNKGCKNCEFNTPDQDRNGYDECWGEKGRSNPHIFELYHGGSVKAEIHGSYLNELIAAGKTYLSDIDTERLKNAKGEIGPRAARQILQLEKTSTGEEWFSPALRSELELLPYPLHFIDFETYTGALPFHAGMRPYELLAFQWSCHTIDRPGAAPKHAEWIHTGAGLPDGNSFPNFEFARSLMRYIGDNGTPLMWATHENTTLRTILGQMPIFGETDSELEHWLRRMTTDKNEKREGRWVDMNNMALKHYFHPYMQGRTSIKKVLPAVWSHFPYLHEVEWFKDYKPDPFLDGIKDPYDTLTGGETLYSEDGDVVKGGTDAMRAYSRIRFDAALSPEQREELRRQLLQYCKLDTMAMVIIWYHWQQNAP